MNTPRSLRTFVARSALFAALTVPALAISNEELSSLRAKAELGNAVAQYNLGMIYAATNDPISDPVEAYVWLNLAADNGATGHALVALNGQLTPEQLSEGKRRLEVKRAEFAARHSESTRAPARVPLQIAAAPTPADSNPISAPGAAASPIAAPTAEDTGAAQADLKKMSAELAAAWKENEQLKASLAKATENLNGANQLKADLQKARAENATLESQRADLQQKLAAASAAPHTDLSPQLADANNRLKAAENELIEAHASIDQLNTAKANIAQLNDRVQKLTAENERLVGASTQHAAAAQTGAQKELADARAQISQLQAQLADAKTKGEASAASAKETEDLQVKLEAATRSYQLREQEIDRLQKALANIDGERESVAKQLEETKAAQAKNDASTQQQIADLKKQLESARATSGQSDAAQKELADTQAKLRDAQASLSKAEQDRDQARRQLASQSVSANAAADAAKLKTELNDARERLAASEQALARARAEREQGNRDAARAAQQELEQARAQLNETRQNLASAQEALTKSNQQIDTLRQQIASAPAPDSGKSNGEMDSLRADLKNTQDALAAANAERSSLASRLAAAETAKPAASAEAPAPAAASTEDAGAVRHELEVTQSKLDAALRTYQLKQDEVDQLQKSLANIDNERQQLADKLQAATGQASQATAQAAVNQDATAQLANAREQIRQSQNEIASLATENRELKNRLALSGPPPSSLLAAPRRPASPAAAQPPVARTVPTPSPTPATRTYTVVDGDTLTKISRHFYGSGEKWSQILEANRNVIRDPNNLTVGTSLKVP